MFGPGGVRELLWLERTENYIDKFLDHEPLSAGDVIVIYSHSGTNAEGITAEGHAAIPTFVSPTVAGASVSSNDEVFAEHARYLHAARGRALEA